MDPLSSLSTRAAVIGAASTTFQAAKNLYNVRGYSKSTNEGEPTVQTSVSKTMEKGDSLSPHPRRLYDLETDESYTNSFGRYCGIVNRSWFLWELAKEPQDDRSVPEASEEILNLAREWAQLRKELSTKSLLRFGMIGYDKKHAHRTVIVSCSDSMYRNEIEDKLQSLLPLFETRGFGYLVLDSKPEISLGADLENASQTWTVLGKHKASENSFRKVYLTADQSSKSPPCQVAFRSSPRGVWQKSAIGGTLWNGTQIMGLVVIQHQNRGLSAVAQQHQDTLSAPEQVKQQLLKPAPWPVGELLGTLGDREDLQSTQGAMEWAFVQLNISSPSENVIQVPNGFGEAFAITEPADESLLGSVYVVTGRNKILTGHQITTRDFEGQLEIRIEVAGDLDIHDCGSWVVHMSTRSFVGIIVDVSRDLALVLPARRILTTSISLPDSRKSGELSFPTPRQSFVPIKDDERSRLPPKERLHDRSSLTNSVLCCFRKRESVSPSFTQSIGKRYGDADGETIWEIDGPYKLHWNAVRPQVEDIVLRTPTKSEIGTAPIVLLRGFMAGGKEADALPTLFITSSSESYAKQLHKAIRRSGVLERYNFRIKVVRDPIRKNPQGAGVQGV